MKKVRKVPLRTKSQKHVPKVKSRVPRNYMGKTFAAMNKKLKKF